MSEPALYDLTHTKPATRPSVARARLRKLEGAAVGAMAGSSAAVGLTISALGAISALCSYAVGRQNLSEVGSEMGLVEAKSVLARRGLAEGEFSFVLAALTAAGLLVCEEGAITMPLFDAELDEHRSKVANRSAGWGKRVGDQSRPEAEKSAPRPALELISPVQPSPLGKIAAGAKKGTAKVLKQKMQAGKVNRFGAVDGIEPDDADPTVARISCECGGVAEVTQAYVDHLQTAYRGLDVLDAVRKAAVWCDGNRVRRKKMTGIRRFIGNWLNNQSRDADIRAAVVRANNQRNGFGQGGSYDDEVATPPSVGLKEASELDFDDLTVDIAPKASAVEDVDAIPDVPARASAVARARARIQVAPGVHQPSRQPANAQLRLSEQPR